MRPPKTLTTSEVCKLCRVTKKAVAGWAKAGHITREATGRYLASSVHAHIKRRRSEADPVLLTVKNERLRLASAQADAIELRNAATRGDLISQSEVNAAWLDLALRMKAAFSNVAQRVASKNPHIPRVDIVAFDVELKDAMTLLKQP